LKPSKWPTISFSSYLDVETGEVRSITEEEVDLAEDPQTVIEELPDWQREAVKLARSIQEQEGKRRKKATILPGRTAHKLPVKVSALQQYCLPMEVVPAGPCAISRASKGETLVSSAIASKIARGEALE
jgi:hypothetical protein